MIIGYARVSTDNQILDLQMDALKAAGCERIESDQGVRGAMTRRPGLDRVLQSLSVGDVLVVWKLDRLGRSLSHLIEVVASLNERGIGFRSLTEAINSETASGQLLFHVIGALAQFERELIRERINAGLQAAKRKGKKLGRHYALSVEQVWHARELLEAGRSQWDVGRLFNVSHMAVQRALARVGP